MYQLSIKQRRNVSTVWPFATSLFCGIWFERLAKLVVALANKLLNESGFRMRKTLQLAVFSTSLLLGACATKTTEDPYVLYRELMPRSILVLPAINESVDVNATYSWLTTASKPIAEQGYYVFPVAVVDDFMKENGLPHPEDMHAAPLDKIGEIFGADAVMYVTIEDYGQKFELIQSTTKVIARAELVDVKTGQSIWASRVDYAQASGDGGQGLLGALIVAAATQVGDTLNDAVHDAARLANVELFVNGNSRSQPALLLGPDHPGFEEQMALAAEAAQEAAQQLLEEQGTLPDTANTDTSTE